MILKFKPIEGLIFNKPSVKSPEARGPYTVQRSYSIPNNSTLVGAVLTALMNINRLEKDFSLDWSNLKDVNEKLSRLGLEFYGPYVTKGKDTYVSFFDKLVNRDKLEEKLRKIIKDAKEDSKNINVLDVEFIEDDTLPKKVFKIGIALDNEQKIVREGYLYSQEIVFMEDFSEELYFVLDILSENKKLLDSFNSIIRLGGKGRISHVSISEEEGLYDNIKNEQKEVEYAVLISNAIIDLEVNNAHELNKLSFEDLIMKIDNKTKEKYGFSLISGRLEFLSLGWDINREIRKPYYLTIISGSLIKITDKNKIKNLKVGELTNLGFGSMFPIKVDNYS